MENQPTIPTPQKNLKTDQLSDTPKDQAQPLSDHLEELRGRILWSLFFLFCFSVVAYHYTDFFIQELGKTVGSFVFLKPTEAFVSKLKVALIVGTFFSVPIFIYHFWRFIGVALTISERRVFLGALPFSYLLFSLGAVFSWFFVVPTGLKFLLTFGSDSIQPFLSISSCLQFAFWLTFGLGLLFQLPVIVSALASWGMVRSSTLRYYRRHFILGILVLSAVLTPGPDVVSQLLLALPTYILFEASVLLAKLLEPKDRP